MKEKIKSLRKNWIWWLGLFILFGVVLLAFIFREYITENKEFSQVLITAILATITFIYVLLTGGLANSSKESTEATREHVIIAQESNEIQVRPVVVLRELEDKEKVRDVISNYIQYINNVSSSNLDEIKKEIGEEKRVVYKVLLKEIYKEVEEKFKKYRNTKYEDEKEVQALKRLFQELKKLFQVCGGKLHKMAKIEDIYNKIKEIIGEPYNKIEEIYEDIKEKLKEIEDKFRGYREIEFKIRSKVKESEWEEINNLYKKFRYEDDKEKRKEKGNELKKKLNDLFKKYGEEICKELNEQQEKQEMCKELREKGGTTYENLNSKYNELLSEYNEYRKKKEIIERTKELGDLMKSYNNLYGELERLNTLAKPEEQLKELSKKRYLEEFKKKGYLDLVHLLSSDEESVNSIIENIAKDYLSIKNSEIFDYIQIDKNKRLPLLDFIFQLFDVIKLVNIGKGPVLNLKIVKISRKGVYLAKELRERYYVMTGINAGENQDIHVKFKGSIEKEKLIKEVFEGYEKDKNVQKLIKKKMEEDDDNDIVLVYEDIFKNRFITIHKEIGGEYSKTMEFYKLERNREL